LDQDVGGSCCMTVCRDLNSFRERLNIEVNRRRCDKKFLEELYPEYVPEDKKALI